jgi:type IV pilus assembly protein PilO
MGDALEKFLAVPTGQKVAIFVLVLGGIYAGWYTLVAEEYATKTQSQVSEKGRLNKRMTEAKLQEQNLEKLEEEIEELTRISEEMRDRLPDNAEIPSLLQKIHAQGKIVGLEIQRFERDVPTPEDRYVRIPVKMTLVGSFHQIATFFYYVGKLTRIVNVENIELTSTSEPSADGTELRAQCTATTYMYRPNQVPGGGGAKKK